MTTKVDVTIVGMGILGLATAHELVNRHAGLKVMLLEKEAGPALHQTGRNSGVIHSGLYYQPGSSKAKNCLHGKKLLEAFCQLHEIPYEICGKVIIAVNEEETNQLRLLMERAGANGVNCEFLESTALKDHEPNTAGVAGLHVPGTGIVDYKVVCQKLLEVLGKHGTEHQYNTRVLNLRVFGSSTCVETTQGEVESRYVVNCAGLHSDRVAGLSGIQSTSQIVPFRGEYYSLRASARHLCRNLIYPVPDPGFPFLGVHLTRMIGGGVECGPNAVLAFAREGYRKMDINVQDCLETIRFPGFRRLVSNHWKSGIEEMWRSFNKTAFTRAIQRLVPAIQSSDLETAPGGVRAQAVLPSGVLVDDFLIQRHNGIINVLNAPSPAATSSLAIGETIVDQLGLD